MGREQQFVNNVYRHSLALASASSPPPLSLIFPVYNLTRSPLTAALYYLNAWNRLMPGGMNVCLNGFNEYLHEWIRG